MTLLFFTAEWCAACPGMKELLMKLNVPFTPIDPYKENPELAERYGVAGFPTLVVVDEAGNALRRHTGAISFGELRKFCEGVA